MLRLLTVFVVLFVIILVQHNSKIRPAQHCRLATNNIINLPQIFNN